MCSKALPSDDDSGRDRSNPGDFRWVAKGGGRLSVGRQNIPTVCVRWPLPFKRALGCGNHGQAEPTCRGLDLMVPESSTGCVWTTGIQSDARGPDYVYKLYRDIPGRIRCLSPTLPYVYA